MSAAAKRRQANGRGAIDVLPELGPLSAGLSNHSIESERAILGGILLDPSVFDGVARILAVEDFYHERNQHIFRVYLDLREEGVEIDMRTVQARMEQRGVLAHAGGISYLATLDLDLPDIGRIDAYAAIVRDRSRRRALVRSAVELVGKASNGSTIEELSSAVAICSRATAVMVAEDSPDVPRFMTEEEIDSAVFPPPSWILGNFLAVNGATMLAGKPGAGKTWFALELAMRLARGMDFLDLDCPDPRRVLYIAGEKNYADYKYLIGKLAKGLATRSPEGRMALQLWEGGRLNGSAPQAALLQDCLRFGAEVIVLDSLGVLFDLGNENETEKWIDVKDFLLALMRAGVSVLALHHANKTADINGSLSNIRVVDQAFVLAKPEDRERDLDVDATLRYVKARQVAAQYTAPLTLHLQDNIAGPGSIGYVRVDAGNDRRKLCVQVWDREDQPSVKQVSSETGIPLRTVYRYLQTAFEAKETRREPRSYKE